MIILYQAWEVKPPTRLFYRKEEFSAILETVSRVGEGFCGPSCHIFCPEWNPPSGVLNFFLVVLQTCRHFADYLTFGLLLLLSPLLCKCLDFFKKAPLFCILSRCFVFIDKNFYFYRVYQLDNLLLSCENSCKWSFPGCICWFYTRRSLFHILPMLSHRESHSWQF